MTKKRIDQMNKCRAQNRNLSLF